MNGCAHMVLVVHDDGSFTCRKCGLPSPPAHILAPVAPPPPYAPLPEVVLPSPEPDPPRRCIARTYTGERCANNLVANGMCQTHLDAATRKAEINEARNRPGARRAERSRCEGVTAKGTRCTRYARNGKRRCAMHDYGSFSGDLGYVDTRAIAVDENE